MSANISASIDPNRNHFYYIDVISSPLCWVIKDYYICCYPLGSIQWCLNILFKQLCCDKNIFNVKTVMLGSSVNLWCLAKLSNLVLACMGSEDKHNPLICINKDITCWMMHVNSTSRQKSDTLQTKHCYNSYYIDSRWRITFIPLCWMIVAVLQRSNGWQSICCVRVHRFRWGSVGDAFHKSHGCHLLAQKLAPPSVFYFQVRWTLCGLNSVLNSFKKCYFFSSETKHTNT